MAAVAAAQLLMVTTHMGVIALSLAVAAALRMSKQVVVMGLLPYTVLAALGVGEVGMFLLLLHAITLQSVAAVMV